jgi:hypothetical protein
MNAESGGGTLQGAWWSGIIGIASGVNTSAFDTAIFAEGYD